MTPEQTAFMNQRHLPYRLNAIQVGWLLGFCSYDITVLTSRGCSSRRGGRRRIRPSISPPHKSRHFIRM
jgi:hypothetical protein